MDFDLKTYGAIIAAFVGAFVGSSIKEISTIYQLYREDKRQLKTCLFHQLELWFELTRYDSARLADLVVFHLSSPLVKMGNSSQQVATFSEPVRNQLRTIFERVKLGEPERLKGQYQTIVSDLAKIDPLLAYRISGRANIEGLIAKSESMFIEMGFPPAIPGQKNPLSELGAELISIAKDKLLKESSIQLKKEIYAVARRIDLFTLIRTYFRLRNLEKQLEFTFSKEADELFDKSMSHIKAHYEKAIRTDAKMNQQLSREVLLRQIADEISLKNPAVIPLHDSFGVTFSWDCEKNHRHSFDIRWTEFHQAYGSELEQLMPYVKKRVAEELAKPKS